jgi:hypothetical protein
MEMGGSNEGLTDNTNIGGSKMNRRHYEEVARNFYLSKPRVREGDSEDYIRMNQWEIMVEEFASRFAKTNKGFSRERFITKCENG